MGSCGKVAEYKQFPLILETVGNRLLFIFLVGMEHFPFEEVSVGKMAVVSHLCVVNYTKDMTFLIYILGYMY